MGAKEWKGELSDDPRGEFSSLSLTDLLGSQRDALDGSEIDPKPVSTPRHKKLRDLMVGMASGHSAAAGSRPSSPIAESFIRPVKMLLSPTTTFVRLKDESKEMSRQTPEWRGELSDDPEAESGSWSLRDLLGSQRDAMDGSEIGSEPVSTPRHKKLRDLMASGHNAAAGSRPSSPITESFMKPIKMLLAPSTTFVRLKDEREEMSRQTPSPPKEPTASRDGITLPLIGEVKWEFVKQQTKLWLQNPKNLALLMWVIAVAVSGAILFMVLVGMLDKVIPKKSDRDTWFEVSNQILNSLFTLMVLYVHPMRILHMVWLMRWRPKDIIQLRQVYSKGGLCKPNEWTHMLVVVLLLHLNCFAQYALCGLNWGYKRANRPAIGVAITLSTSFGAAAAAGIYNSLSPLAKDFVVEEGEEEHKEVVDRVRENESTVELADKIKRGQGSTSYPHHHHHSKFHKHQNYKLLKKSVSSISREGRHVENPQWEGGLFDCYQEPRISLFSTACLPCVLGWNLDRMGFGNRYVHIATFLLLCSAPCLVFMVAAVNIDNRVVQHSFAATGIVLSLFGLLYGGFWRIRMRERYNLPQTNWCCGCPGVTNCAQWLFCAPCSLCQEVRTAEAYEIKDDKFYMKKTSGNNTPGTSPEHLLGHHHIDVDMPVSSSSIQPLPISSMVPIKEMELALSERMTADGTMFLPPPPQNLTPYPS